MAANTASFVTKCAKCRKSIEIEVVDDVGGRDDGGFILQCLSCGHIFDDYIGHDVHRSSVRNGAKLLERYGKNLEHDREGALRRHGLTG
jgi:hypothetical protein